MINKQMIHSNWTEIQGKLKSKWGSLTDDDVKEFDGNVEQLMTKLQKKTGAGRESIEQFFDQFNPSGASTMSRVSETARGYAHQATEAIQETSQHALDSVREGYAEVEDFVRKSPTKSLAYCFGAGVLTGIVVNLLLRSR